MDLPEVEIAPKEGKKGRSFRALCFTHTEAGALWEGGKTDTKSDVLRPVHAVFLGSEDALRPFSANLALGREALLVSENGHSRDRKKGFEFLRSAGYKQSWQRHAAGSILTVYMPELFAVDPGMVDPEEIKFICMPSRAWAQGQTGIDRDAIVAYAKKLPVVKKLNSPPKDDRGWRDASQKFVKQMPDDRLRGLVELAYDFTLRLDRRSRAPIPADGRFYLQVLLACLEAGMVSFATTGDSRYREMPFGEHSGLGFKSENAEGAGFLPGVAFKAKHDALEALLAAEVEIADAHGLFKAIEKGK